MLVATYGTLKRGHNNWNYHLKGRSTFISEGVVRGFKLYYAGFPVAAPSNGDCIKVEVFDIGDQKDVLQGLDRLEGYREDHLEGSMYHRIEVDVHTDKGTITTGMYVGNPESWRDFKGMREMGKDDNGIYQWP